VGEEIAWDMVETRPRGIVEGVLPSSFNRVTVGVRGTAAIGRTLNL
jgi:hypothetical protein